MRWKNTKVLNSQKIKQNSNARVIVEEAQRLFGYLEDPQGETPMLNANLVL
jgi:hypothetical protein